MASTSRTPWRSIRRPDARASSRRGGTATRRAVRCPGGPAREVASPTATPWLPLPPDLDRRNVEAETTDPDSVLAFYRRLLWLRRENAALYGGAQELVDVGDADVLAYRRAAEGASALVLLNFASRPATVQLPDASPTGAAAFAASGRRGLWRVALSTHERTSGDALAGPVILAPLEVLIAYD